MREIILYTIFIAVVVFLSWFSLKLDRKRRAKYQLKMTQSNFVVKYPKSVMFGMICGSLIFVLFDVLCWISNNKTAVLWVHIGFWLMALVPLVFLYWMISKKVVVDNDKITYRTVFYKNKEITFDDITSVKYGRYGLSCYSNGKKLFGLEYSTWGFELFLKRVENKRVDN